MSVPTNQFPVAFEDIPKHVKTLGDSAADRR